MARTSQTSFQGNSCLHFLNGKGGRANEGIQSGSRLMRKARTSKWRRLNLPTGKAEKKMGKEDLDRTPVCEVS